MTDIEFEWDSRKARANLSKHDISFQEASSVFYDELGLLLDDPDHSEEEHHFILLGLSTHLRVLVVVHCFREPDDAIRIISARRATRSETHLYQDQLRS
jgi:hypothetical protein